MCKTSLFSAKKSEAGFSGLVLDFRKVMQKNWLSSRKTAPVVRDLENIFCAERLKDLCVFI